jgi:DNA-binding CsgD family transcriptional regulator
MKSIEFYTTPNNEVMIQDDAGTRMLSQTDIEFIGEMEEIIMEFYPEANKALSEYYKASIKNPSFNRFLKVRRFIKCNFSNYDNVLDIDHIGRMNFEFVACPMRGECKHDGVICNPKFNSSLSVRELEVMQMCYEGKNDNEIASALFISLNTVNNHRKNSFKKLHIHSMADFIRYAKDNNLFKN